MPWSSVMTSVTWPVVSSWRRTAMATALRRFCREFLFKSRCNLNLNLSHQLHPRC